MTKVPNLNYGQVINALRRDGWVIVRQKGSHIRLQKHTTERTLKLTVPAHKKGKTIISYQENSRFGKTRQFTAEDAEKQRTAKALPGVILLGGVWFYKDDREG